MEMVNGSDNVKLYAYMLIFFIVGRHTNGIRPDGKHCTTYKQQLPSRDLESIYSRHRHTDFLWLLNVYTDTFYYKFFIKTGLNFLNSPQKELRLILAFICHSRE